MANLRAFFKRTRLLVLDPRKFFMQTHRSLRPIPREYRKQFRMNMRQWFLYHQKDVAFDKCHWMGVRALKNPLDAWIYQEVIYDVKPDIVIEIGSFEGGGTLFLANILDLLGNGRVISVDVDRANYNVRHNRIITFTGDSSSPEIFRKVSKICHGKSVLIIHDGDHSKEQVLKDLKLYSGLVSIGSYIIVEDGVMDFFKPGDGIGSYVDGPYAACQDFLNENPNFIVDKERERYILTYNPKGFLKRVR